jgi:hypothetical protein
MTMATQYCCANENRRDAVRNAVGPGGKPILNGIDYLEVVSQDQKTLEVHFIHNLPGQTEGVPSGPGLDKFNFVIEGGARVHGIAVESLDMSQDKIATLTVSAAGDYSTYTLRLVAGEGNSEAPDGFDAQLAAVGFCFKVECPSEFDCRRDADCPAQAPPAPAIDYLAKDYASFRRVILDRMAVLQPDWKERNPADLEVALAEAIAYAGDRLSYFQDSVATEAYLGTARQRISMRRHARLLDYAMHDGCNARAWISLQVQAGSVADGWAIPAGTPLLTRGRDDSVTVDPADYERVLREEDPTVFETLHPITPRSAHNAILFYTWDDTECCLPKGATRATLYNDPPLSLAVGDVLVFEEVLGCDTGLPADADPEHRHAVRLTGAATTDGNGDPLVDPLHGIPIAEVSWDAKDALPFPLCLSTKIDLGLGAQQITDLSLARGNVVLADHGRTLPSWTVGQIGTDAAGRLVEPMVPEGPLTQQGRARDGFGEPVLDPYREQVVVDPQSPAAAAVAWQMGDVLPAIKLVENGDPAKTWLPRRDLLASNRFDRHFVVEVDNSNLAHLRFGDGFHGAIPKPDSNFEAVYRVGNGNAGNVGRESICRIVLSVAGMEAVRNPFAGAGGTETETIEQVRQYAPQAFRTQERAVTEADWAAAAERHPEVQKAAATLRWTGSWYTVFITVDRLGGRSVDSSFEEELRRFLDRFRLAGQDLEVDAPRLVPLDIAFSVCVKPGYYRSQVKEELLKVFGNRDLSDGRRGFFHPDNFTFGQAVALSRMIALAMQVPGVGWVDAEDAPGKPNRFRRWGRPAQGEFAAGEIAFGRLEIARLDNDASLPENGKLDFFMDGGL